MQFYTNEDTFTGIILWEQSLEGLGIGEGGDGWVDHDWCWDTHEDALSMISSVGDLTGYLLH